MTGNDRTVHGYTKDGAEVVRYDRAGKYRIERADGSHSSYLTLAEAVAAIDTYLGRKMGGQALDAAMRRKVAR